MDISKLVIKISQVDALLSTLQESQNFSIHTYAKGDRIVFNFDEPEDQIALANGLQNYRDSLKDSLRSQVENI